MDISKASERIWVFFLLSIKKTITTKDRMILPQLDTYKLTEMEAF